MIWFSYTMPQILALNWSSWHTVQVTVPLILTLTVPDQNTADIFHTSAANPPFRSPRDPSVLATRADEAALSLSALARAGAFRDIPMPSLAANLKLATVPYPVITGANVSIIFTETSENFTAVQSEQVDTLQVSLLAFAEAAAFELHIALHALPELSESLDVSPSALCVCLLVVRWSLLDTAALFKDLFVAVPDGHSWQEFEEFDCLVPSIDVFM
jgi:hypothetical protein